MLSDSPHTNKPHSKDMLWCALHCQTQLSGAIIVNGVSAQPRVGRVHEKRRDFVFTLTAGAVWIV